MKRAVYAGLGTLALVLAAPANAGATADFSGCDGLKKPKSKDDGMRGNATMPAFNIRSPQRVISSCTAALERKELKPHQNLRRAHLLRARAIAYIENGSVDLALNDLDAAEAELINYRGKFFFDRSMGVSLDLLRGIVLSENGDVQGAIELAKKAADARPYAVKVQMAATLIQDQNADKETDRELIWENLVRVEPASRQIAEDRVAASLGPDALFTAQIEKAGDQPLDIKPFENFISFSGGSIESGLLEWIGQYADGLTLAYALAAKGEVERSQERLAEVSDAIEAVKAGSEDQSPLFSLAQSLMVSVEDDVLNKRRDLVLARLAIAEDRPAEVATILDGHEYQATTEATDLHTAYDALLSESENELAAIAPLGPVPKRDSSNLRPLSRTLLITPEDERSVIDYEKSRPDVLGGLVAGVFSLGISLLGGFDRTEGFRSEELEDGAIKVEYIGSSTSASVVQEMTLLRAAEIAREAGKSDFLIRSRSDFGRYWGTSFERTLTGYKTILEIVYLEENSENPAAISAVDVIDNLGRIYYKSS